MSNITSKASVQTGIKTLAKEVEKLKLAAWVGVKCAEARLLDLRAFVKKAGYKIVGIGKGIASGAKQERAERKKVLEGRPARST